jgi:hypothetical protein
VQIADLPVLNPVGPVREPPLHGRTVFLFVECDHQIGLLEILGLHLNGSAMIVTDANPKAAETVDGVL